MRVIAVLLSICAATQAYAEEPQFFLSGGCYTMTPVINVLRLPEDEGVVLMARYMGTGICGPVIYSEAAWNRGQDIGRSGVRILYAHPYNWAQGEIDTSQLPPAQAMYFQASSNPKE